MSPRKSSIKHRQLAVVIALAFGPACTGMDEPGGEPRLEGEGEDEDGDEEQPVDPAGGLSPSGRDAALAGTNGVAESSLVFDFDGSNPVLYSSGGWMLHAAAPPSDQGIEVSFSSQALGTDGNRSSPYPGYDDENSFATVGPITLGNTLSMRSWHVDEGGGYYDRKRVFFQSDAGMSSTWVLADCANEVPTAFGMPASSDLPFCQFYSASRPGDQWD